MERKVIQTSDGSSTIEIIGMEETYHSRHGAIQEAKHVFIAAGLMHISLAKTKILEVGFGTGLNALLTAIECEKSNKKVEYTGLEAYPVAPEMIAELNYTDQTNQQTLFKSIHDSSWEEMTEINSKFYLKKLEMKLEDLQITNEFDLIYFDAFGFRAQPEMWDIKLLEICKNAMKKNGVFVTYAAKGQLKRDLKSLGFEVESIPGPPGKREMTRATLK